MKIPVTKKVIYMLLVAGLLLIALLGMHYVHGHAKQKGR